MIRVKTSIENFFQTTNLPRINLFVPEANLAQLESHMPQSGFEYVRGGMFINGALKKVKIRYRGDYSYHWGWDKKSIRIKTGKGNLYGGLRIFNLQAPKAWSQLNNYLSLKLAEQMGLLTPRIEIVRLFLNGQDRGVYIFIEQPSETTLRNANLMPGDIYRGEMVAKGKFTIPTIKNKKLWLFDSTSFWDKVSVNNHYDLDSVAPLEALLNLFTDSDGEGRQTALSEIMDMEAWGRFSAFETLARTKHYGKGHNWRLYYDPWRGKFYPLVWDPAGWIARPEEVGFNVISSKLHRLLFRNGDFLRARNTALEEFFSLGLDALFLDHASSAIETMKAEIKTDMFLRPGSVLKVVDAMERLRLKSIERTFSMARDRLFTPDDSLTKYHYRNLELEFLVDGYRPIQMIRVKFDKELDSDIGAHLKYETAKGTTVVDLSQTIEFGSNSITLRASVLPDITLNDGNTQTGGIDPLQVDPGYYQIHFDGLDPKAKLLELKVNRGQGWIPAEPVDSITPTAFSQLYAPVAVNTVPEPITWSGEVTLEGHQILDQPLIIEPGTTVNLTPGATLVLKHRLTAIGTREAPIRFMPARDEQEPWGAIVLSGRGADGSTLSHCEMAGGSGLKGDLFEYSAMLSIHDVKDVVISDCQFRDNHVVDDMVHTVYADIRFERVLFKNALSDALDLDISTASISDSHVLRTAVTMRSIS